VQRLEKALRMAGMTVLGIPTGVVGGAPFSDGSVVCGSPFRDFSDSSSFLLVWWFVLLNWCK